MTRRTYGVEEARRRLPELLESARRGEPVVITRHGRPYAALVEPAAAAVVYSGAGFARLRGSGRGVWQQDAALAIDALRDEWPNP